MAEIVAGGGIGAIERALADGDIGKLSTDERVEYLIQLCGSLKLNPLTSPIQLIRFQGGDKVIPYVTASGTAQLRKANDISIKLVGRELDGDMLSITALATTPDGREDESTGVVSLPKPPEARANAMMRAETKAKRRATLSLVGLNMPDEESALTIPGASVEHVEVSRAPTPSLTDEIIAADAEPETPAPAPAPARPGAVTGPRKVTPPPAKAAPPVDMGTQADIDRLHSYYLERAAELGVQPEQINTKLITRSGLVAKGEALIDRPPVVAGGEDPAPPASYSG